MQKNPFTDELEDISEQIPKQNTNNFADKLIACDISVKFCEYKISNTENKMLVSKIKAATTEALLIESPYFFDAGALMRIWIEIPNYWVMKSKKVNYRHTQAPKYFQILSKVKTCEENYHNNGFCFVMTCENLTIDPIDSSILNEYLLNQVG